MRIANIIKNTRIAYKTPVVLCFVVCLLATSRPLWSQQGANSDSRLYQNGAEVILDGSLHTTGASRTDKFFENVGVSTPSTPSSLHSRTWLNSTTHQLCTIFDNGAVTC